MRRQPVGVGTRLAQRRVAIARPWIIRGIGHPAGAQRIEFDVTHQRQQVPLAVHHRRAVAPLPEGAAAAMGGIKIVHVSPAHRLQDLADRVPTFRRCQHVDVVGHPDLGMDSQTLLGGRLDPGPTKKPVVRVSAKEGLPVIAALNAVPRLARNDAAGETRHVASYRGTGGKKPSTNIVSDPFLFPRVTEICA